MLFGATLSSKRNVVRVWKELFLVFWEKDAKHYRLFKSKFGLGKLLTKWFWSYLELKSECSEHLKKAFFSFFKFLSDIVEIIFLESKAKHSKLLKSKFGGRKLLRKWLRSYLELENKCSVRSKRALFNFLQISEWWSRKYFLGKYGLVFKSN